eukprot:scaffold72737_cov19-Tisochrysis_lutea.AAC.5
MAVGCTEVPGNVSVSCLTLACMLVPDICLTPHCFEHILCGCCLALAAVLSHCRVPVLIPWFRPFALLLLLQH